MAISTVLHTNRLGWVMLAAGSLPVFIRLLLTGRLHARRDRIGQTYAVGDGSYTVFRETVASTIDLSEPCVLVVGFRLKLLRGARLPHWLFQRVCILTTPFWSGLRGFDTKLWMVDRDTENYLGIYQWKGEQATRTYLRALETVLGPLSVGPVWSNLHAPLRLGDYLTARQINGKG